MKLDRMFRLTTDVLHVDELNDAGIDLHIVDLNGESCGHFNDDGTVLPHPHGCIG